MRVPRRGPVGAPWVPRGRPCAGGPVAVRPRVAPRRPTRVWVSGAGPWRWLHGPPLPLTGFQAALPVRGRAGRGPLPRSSFVSSLCPSFPPSAPSARPPGRAPARFASRARRGPSPCLPPARPPAGVVACGRGPVVPRRRAPLRRARPSASRAPAGRRGPAAAAAPPPGGPGLGPEPLSARARARVGRLRRDRPVARSRLPGPPRGPAVGPRAPSPLRAGRGAPSASPVPGPVAVGIPRRGDGARGALVAGSALRHLPSRRAAPAPPLASRAPRVRHGRSRLPTSPTWLILPVAYACLKD